MSKIYSVYRDDVWSIALQAFPANVDPRQIELSRSRLEDAAVSYIGRRITANRMTGALSKREKWQRVVEASKTLMEAIDGLDEWDPPIWGFDEDAKPSVEQTQWIHNLQCLGHTALENSWTYNSYVKRFAGRKDPDRENLFDTVFGTWTAMLSQKLATSRRKGQVCGPLLTFSAAVLRPVIGSDFPKPETFKKMVDRAKERRYQAHKSAMGRLKQKSEFKAPLGMVE